MFAKLKLSLKNINYKLFIALLVMGLCPTIYTTLRVFWLGELPGKWSFSIAGQLSWVNLLYEVINEAIILPLFYFIGKVILDNFAEQLMDVAAIEKPAKLEGKSMMMVLTEKK